MKAVFKEAKVLQKAVSTMNSLIDEGEFTVTESGIKTVCMDPANVAMLILELKRECFESLEVKGEERFRLRISELKEVLKRAKKEGNILFEVENNKLTIIFINEAKKTFNLPLIADLTDKPQAIPVLSFKAKIKMKSKIFKDLVQDVDWLSDSLTFVANEKKFTINSTQETNKSGVGNLFGFSEIEKFESIEVNENTKCKYATEYIQKMIHDDIGENVSVGFSNDYPIRIDYESGTLDISFILAPRVEND